MKKKEIIFGIHPILDALKSGKSLSKIWVKSPSSHLGHRQILHLAREKSVPCSRVPLIKLRQLTAEKHQGAVALRAPIPFVPLSPLLQRAYEEGRAPLIVVLSHIEDSRNLGALIRSAVAMQVDALVLPTQGAARIDGNTMKTSVGGLLKMPIVRVDDLAATLSELQESGLQVIGCSEKVRQPLSEVNFTLPTALLLGGEAKGIAEKYLSLCDQTACIPMRGGMESLNLSVAGGVLLYEVVRQRYLSKL